MSMQEAIQQFAEKLDTIETEEEYKLIRSQPWFSAFSEQGRQMLRIANDSALQNICYLTLDSALFFWEWLRTSAQITDYVRQQRWLIDSSPEVNKYLRAWACLTEYCILPKGGIHQETAQMEFYSAFFAQVSDYFQQLDRTQNGYVRRCTVLLVPRLCRRIKTFEMFRHPYKDDLEQPKSTLLLLEIPIEHIHDFDVIIALVHESAHYFGNRLRGERLRRVLRCLVIFLQAQFGLEESDTLVFLHNELVKQTILKQKDKTNLLFWDLFSPLMQEAVTRMLHQPNFSYDLAKVALPAWRKRLPQFLQWADREVQSRIGKQSFLLLVPGVASGASASLTEKQMSTLQLFMEQLGYFTKECHSDVMLIYTLKLQMPDYLQLCIKHEFRYLHTESPLAHSRVWQRFFMVYEAMKKLAHQKNATSWLREHWGSESFVPEDMLQKMSLSDEHKDLLQQGFAKIRIMKEDYSNYPEPEDEGTYLIPAGAVIEREGQLPYCIMKQLIEYLFLCLKEVNKTNTDKIRHTQDQLYEVYQQVVVDRNNEQFNAFLQERREQMFRNIRESTPFLLDAF